MKDNDLSAAPTKRYWVTADVVFHAVEVTDEKKTGWFRSLRTERVTYTPNLSILSMLWQWSASLGVRMELVFFGDLTTGAPELWRSLDGAANPFSDYFVFGRINDVVNMLPYRSDLMGVIDIPDRSAYYGGKGLTIANLH